MKQRVTPVLIISLALVLLVSACQGGGEVTGAPRDPFIGGTSGLVINFERDSPPPEVTDGSSFPFKVIVNLENQGESKVDPNDVTVTVDGFFPPDFQVVDETVLTEQHPDEELLPKTRDTEGDVIDGSLVFVAIPKNEDTFLNPKRFSGNHEFPINAKVCYKYQTRASARLCILKDLTNVGDDELCDPRGSSPIYSSGAPVQFSNFRQGVEGVDKVRFNFDVIHSGNGEIYEPKRTEQDDNPWCPRDILRFQQINIDRVKLGIDLNDDVLNERLVCNLEENGIIRLTGGRRTVTCTLDLEGQHNTDFEKIIDFDVEYNYFDSKETKILVKHLPDVN